MIIQKIVIDIFINVKIIAMAVENHIWNNDGDHLILFIDIMGFKDRVTRMDHNDLLNKLKEFKEKNDRLKPLLEDKKGELLRMVQFSDSIIIASLDDSKSALNRDCRLIFSI